MIAPNSTGKPESGEGFDMAVREPTRDELPRALHLFQNARRREGARLFVAEKARPFARFVGAAAWWTEGAQGRFQLACQPGSAQRESATALIQQVLAAARGSGLGIMQYGELLPDGHVLLPILQGQGFERLRSERSFEIAARDIWMRVSRIFARHGAEMPPQWRTEPIRGHPPEVIWEILAPHRLLPPDQVRAWWQANAAGGFDLEMSCILFDQDRAFGVLLARRHADVLYVDVQVVNEPNRRRRSMADLLLVYHLVRRVTAEGPIRLVQFRCGETEHRQTANLALRMGGREVIRGHVMAKRLTA